MTKRLLLFVLLFCFSTLSIYAQQKRSKKLPTPPPCGIKLLDGYVHIPLQGIDSWFGRIKKKEVLPLLTTSDI